MFTAKPYYFTALCLMSAIFLFMSPASAEAELLVDFGATENSLVESGWEGFEESASTASASRTFLADFGVGGTVDVSVECSTFRMRGTETGELADLLNDLCRATPIQWGDSFITLTLENLEAGQYEFTSFNYNSNLPYPRGNISISVDDAAGSRTLDVVNQDDLATAVNMYALTVDATGSAILTYQSDDADANSAAVLNGFSLASVPEPSSLSMLALGVFVLCGQRYGTARRKACQN